MNGNQKSHGNRKLCEIVVKGECVKTFDSMNAATTFIQEKEKKICLFLVMVERSDCGLN